MTGERERKRGSREMKKRRWLARWVIPSNRSASTSAAVMTSSGVLPHSGANVTSGSGGVDPRRLRFLARREREWPVSDFFRIYGHNLGLAANGRV
jgi:hypothetical protein